MLRNLRNDDIYKARFTPDLLFYDSIFNYFISSKISNKWENARIFFIYN